MADNTTGVPKKEMAKAYEKYAKSFTPKPTYVANCVRAFIAGGLLCILAMFLQNKLMAMGQNEKDAAAIVTIAMICAAQLLTGIGLFDSLTKMAGAGVIVPITGFANSMVAPALEYKKEGLVLGVGGKLFSLAGPVLVYGISSAVAVGILYWLIGGAK